MIVMLVSGEENEERAYIVSYAKNLAGKWTDEYWKMVQCKNIRELHLVVTEGEQVDIICIDITMEGALEMTIELRKASPNSYIILIANTEISPLTYMRPVIGAESLMLKPLDKEQIQDVLNEAIHTYVRRFYQPAAKKVFVLENKGGRDLIDYQHIFFFESRDKKVYVNTGNEEYGFYDTLDQLEDQLSEEFIRCHRSFLVNRDKIVKIFLSQNRILLQEDFEVPLSRTYKPVIKDFLKQMSSKEVSRDL